MARNAAGDVVEPQQHAILAVSGEDAGYLGGVDEHPCAGAAVDCHIGDASSGHGDGHPARRSGPVGKPELARHQADALAVALEARGPERGANLPVPGELQFRFDRIRRHGGSRSELQGTGEHSGGHRPSRAFELVANPVVEPGDIRRECNDACDAGGDQHPPEAPGMPRSPASSGSGPLSTATG